MVGTLNLLNACKSFWKVFDGKCFYHISTDEVYGSLGEEGLFTEETPMIQGVLIQHLKLAQIILLEPMDIHINFR